MQITDLPNELLEEIMTFSGKSYGLWGLVNHRMKGVYENHYGGDMYTSVYQYGPLELILNKYSFIFTEDPMESRFENNDGNAIEPVRIIGHIRRLIKYIRKDVISCCIKHHDGKGVSLWIDACLFLEDKVLLQYVLGIMNESQKDYFLSGKIRYYCVDEEIESLFKSHGIHIYKRRKLNNGL